MKKKVQFIHPCFSIKAILTPLLVGVLLWGDASAQAAEQVALPADAVVSYLGPTGTYTEQAAEQLFPQGADFQPKGTVADAVSDVLNGSADHAVIPQENTIGGPVYDYLDELLSHEELFVVGEVELTIRQALVAPPSTSLTSIQTVYSHKQGIAQGKEWLQANLPDANVVEVSSTAEGAKMAAECIDGTAAAIASTQALPDLMRALDAQGLKLISLHDRPAKTTLGQYVYLAECSGGGQSTFEELAEECGEFSLRCLGCYNVTAEE